MRQAHQRRMAIDRRQDVAGRYDRRLTGQCTEQPGQFRMAPDSDVRAQSLQHWRIANKLDRVTESLFRQQQDFPAG